MDWTDVLTIWESNFEKLGYWESEFNNWVSETQELIIVLCVRVNTREKDFAIDMGIIFKKRYNDHSLKTPVFDDHDIGQGLYNILEDMGELEYYLNNLFCYDPDINTDAEVTDNISELVMLFQKKVIPYFEQLDNYTSQVEDFEEETTWKPFLRYFRPSPENDMLFFGRLEKYYRQP